MSSEGWSIERLARADSICVLFRAAFARAVATGSEETFELPLDLQEPEGFFWLPCIQPAGYQDPTGAIVFRHPVRGVLLHPREDGQPLRLSVLLRPLAVAVDSG